MTYLIIINCSIFLVISALHFYWALSGRGIDQAVVPSKRDGQLLFRPGKISSLVVAFGLLLFAFVTLGNSGVFGEWVSSGMFRNGAWVIAAVFLARAVGDFRYVGFFKRASPSSFARNDTRIYAPLCLLLGVNSALIALLTL